MGIPVSLILNPPPISLPPHPPPQGCPSALALSALLSVLFLMCTQNIIVHFLAISVSHISYVKMLLVIFHNIKSNIMKTVIYLFIHNFRVIFHVHFCKILGIFFVLCNIPLRLSHYGCAF